ncbi:MAG TPA: FG-GAP-like repeat-containing protein, partial [Pyrinomonadaceae bacterium]|nr:FG-GAP-like repeat-containing protein [Pyrinomonadaceae bacterium]
NVPAAANNAPSLVLRIEFSGGQSNGNDLQSAIDNIQVNGTILQAPSLGGYPNTQVALGGNATVTPDAVPTNAANINVSTDTNFKGTFAADPATGVVRVTNAHPAGTYTVTVKTFNGPLSVTRAFTLTVQTGTACNGVSLFTNAADSSVGSHPISVAIGDFNNDGKQDFAAANNFSNNVSIRLGDGSGNFSGAPDVSVGLGPVSVAIGDFNNDGKQDFATANNASATVSIRLGDGSGNFSGATNVSVGSGPVSVAIGDFNNDGKQDFAAANNSSTTISIRLGDGLGGFSGATNVSVGLSPTSVAIGDFNHDGKQDFAAANSIANNVSIRLGDGLGSFSGTTNVSVGLDPLSVAIGDFNNDGKQDFAAANEGANNVSIRLGDGFGGFSGTTNVSVGSHPVSLAIGDFNNDGKQDFATANFNSDTVAISLGDGLGGFSGTTNVSMGLSPRSVAIGDFNHDGKQDFAAANFNANTVSIRLGACNPAPTIAAAVGLSRQQGSPVTNSQIASVTDDGGNGNVTVTVTSANPVNGVTISNIVNTGGNITADIVANCDASVAATFTLQASDGSSTVIDTLIITVKANDPPALTYPNQTVAFNGSLTINPNAIPSDNGSLSSIAVQSVGTYTGGLSVNSATGAVFITNAAPVGTHTITIRATDNCRVTTDASFNLIVNKADQTITFAAIPSNTFGDADFGVSPTATSGLPVSLSASGQCTVTSPSPATVHLTGAGSCNITAKQAGDANYNAAADVPQSFNIAGAATTTAVTSSVNPSALAESVTFTATVSPAPNTTTPTGTIQFKDGGGNLGSPVPLNGSGVATLTTSALRAGMHAITAEYSGDTNFLGSTGTLSGGQLVTNRPLIAFSQSDFNVNENGDFVTITVNRSGDTSPAVDVDYATPDDSAAMTVLPCATASGVASPRCDFTTALGTLKFAAGETSKTFKVLISQDSFVEGNETFTLSLSNLTGGAAFAQPSDANATVTITDDDLTPSTTNPIDDAQNFVRQHYHDFLNREPDADGLNFWTKEITDCGSDQSCIEVKRVNVSAAFFISTEFQNSGYYVERIWKTSFGDINSPTVPVPIRFTNFLRDSQEVGAGVVVGEGNWEMQIDNNKSAFALAFVQRSAFLSRYPALTSATAFVDALDNNAGNVLSDSERSSLITELSPNPADPSLRASVLRKIADNATLQELEFNHAFALMEYFGYLRRDPDAAPEAGLNFAGYNFWLNKLNEFNGNFVNAEMVKAFIISDEYRQRFGP